MALQIPDFLPHPEKETAMVDTKMHAYLYGLSREIAKYLLGIEKADGGRTVDEPEFDALVARIKPEGDSIEVPAHSTKTIRTLLIMCAMRDALLEACDRYPEAHPAPLFQEAVERTEIPGGDLFRKTEARWHALNRILPMTALRRMPVQQIISFAREDLLEELVNMQDPHMRPHHDEEHPV